ncbi:MAG: methylenetetrahydrofolate reductase [NAD(P)H] [Gammaproteobacteria bacterium RIFCSPHIGHO2_12_FULL_37_14]|nr:MAG: methylenetetrahydrofolate reductase [NAD(P)H] [Gammaproteobacteria bacterium RIFCSPHIGHO2_12_FULL_37_14]
MKKNVAPYRISFEFYPPKTPDGVHALIQSAQELTILSPAFFSVTFGAGGSTREGTLEMVRLLQKRTSTSIAPHLSCIGADRVELLEILQQYQTLGVKRLVALRGDLPSGMVSSGDYKFAYDLVRLIREVTGDYFHIEVAAYPEYHPQAKNAWHDVSNLKKKYEAGADSAITQYFFNPDAYFYFLDECNKQNINMPIIPGIMPILQFNKLMRFSEVCGAEVPRWLYKRLESFGDDKESIYDFGVDVLSHLCEQLLLAGAPGLHFYTLNHAQLSMEILTRLNLIALSQIEV